MRLSIPTCMVTIMFAIAPAEAAYEEVAILEALDKITGRVFKLEAVAAGTARIGRVHETPNA